VKRLHKAMGLVVLGMIPIFTGVVANGGPAQPRQLFRQDLHPFGFITEDSSHTTTNYTDINFLSADLVLVTVNKRVYGPVESLFSDQPPSKLLLFDISHKSLLKSTEMSVEKATGSVKAIRDGQFVLLNQSGLLLCSRALECGPPLQTGGPLFVSPHGTRIVVGGNARTEQKLLDASSLKELDHFSRSSFQLIPGDSGFLVRQKGKLYIRLPEEPDKQLSFGGGGIWPQARFLDETTVADYESSKQLAVAKTDGTLLFEVPISARSQLREIVTAASGSRFCYHEAGYTALNSFVNFLDIDSGRDLNFEHIKVLSIDSGKSLFELHWDPRPHVGVISVPALSPDGRRLAAIRHGFLEVFEIP
jgi:hypothetical protein